MNEVLVTIVVVPRDYFSRSRESLESIYEHTKMPFRLVYVDGNSPPYVRRYLEAQARARQFYLIRTAHYLSPNHARNLGLQQVHSRYVVFVDNDVIVTPGWLESLVQCAEETGAAVVGPLVCEGRPLHETLHYGDGELRIVEEQDGEGRLRRRLHEVMHHRWQNIKDIRPTLQRCPTEFAEFHCILVRKEIIEKIGGRLDPGMLSTREHVDLCLSVSQAGGTIYFEPQSQVTFVSGPPFAWSDYQFFMLRWSNAWGKASMQHLMTKWQLDEDADFMRRYALRRRLVLHGTPVGKLIRGLRLFALDRVFRAADSLLSCYLSVRYARNQSKNLPSAPSQKLTRLS